MGSQGACKRPQGTHDDVHGSACRPREERTAGETPDRPAVRRVLAGRPACGARRGQDFEAALGCAWLQGTSLGKARGGLGRRGGVRRARGRSGALERGRRRVSLELFRTGPVRVIKTQFFATKVHQGVNRKVVDLTTLYNFHKGSRVFFSTDFAGTSCQL
jgi:hypothetical protein